MFQQYVEKYKTYLTGWAGLISGKSSSVNFDCDINTCSELNALRNASSAEQLVHLSNAYYDQVAIGRTLKEIYKKPKDYLKQFAEQTALQIAALENTGKEVASQVLSVESTIQQSKSNNALSGNLQKKLSLINSEFDARS